MKLPYGISDFRALREQRNLYIDKTKYIEKLENFNSKYVFFIRPRRFGKSLFLSTIQHYYDINSKTKFDKLFGDLYIGRNPTPLKNSYLVLQIDFSALNTQSKSELEKSFKRRLISEIGNFLVKYEEYFKDVSIPEAELDISNDVGSIIKVLIDVLIKCDKKMYLIIDEYDHFANDIIAMGENEFYKDIIRASGVVRDFYEAVKIGTKSVIDRIFITGASPVMLDDMTSGFNIAANATTNATLNEMLGFTASEMRALVDNVDICKDKEEIVNELRKYYNGYLFNINGNERVYNPDMVLYFFSEWVDTGFYPEQLIDDNVKTDYGKLERLIGNDENREVLEEIIRLEGISASIVTKFSFDRMYDKDYFVSLLFYMGLLTIKSKEYGTTQLSIPNYVIKTVFWEYFEKRLRLKFDVKYDIKEVGKTIWQMGYEGKIKPFLDFISGNVLSTLSNRDLIKFDEKYIKLVLFCYMALTDVYNPISEKEVESGYIDIYLERDIRSRDVRYEWIIELKYLKECERHKLEQIKEEGLNQLQEYANSKTIVGREDIKKVLVVFIGKGEYIIVETALQRINALEE